MDFGPGHPVYDYETKRNKPMPTFNHGAIEMNLCYALTLNYTKVFRAIPELDLDLSGWPSVPDICIVPWRKLDFQNDIEIYTDPPLGIIYILHPTLKVEKYQSDFRRYFENGVKSCWLVLPEITSIYVSYSPKEHTIFTIGETLHDKKLDIKLEVEKIFE